MKQALLVIFIFTCLVNCRKPEQFPETPEIGFLSHQILTNRLGQDSSLLLKFSYRDGDGNLGFQPSDTLPPFNFGSRFFYNIWIDYFEKRNGVYDSVTIPLSNEVIRFDQRLPYITPEGKNKAIRGEIDVVVPLSTYASPPDTIKFDIRLIDRDLNRSNTIESGDIKVTL